MNAPTRTPEAAALANIAAYANDAWDQRIVPALTDYVAAPAKSPMFDAQWADHGLLTASCAMLRPGSRVARWPV